MFSRSCQLIEIRSSDQSTLDLQSKILHCLNHGTQLAWLIDLSRQQIWVWQGDDLPCCQIIKSPARQPYIQSMGYNFSMS
jgi:Uma2 family endonuclease